MIQFSLLVGKYLRVLDNKGLLLKVATWLSIPGGPCEASLSPALAFCLCLFGLATPSGLNAALPSPQSGRLGFLPAPRPTAWGRKELVRGIFSPRPPILGAMILASAIKDDGAQGFSVSSQFPSSSVFLICRRFIIKGFNEMVTRFYFFSLLIQVTLIFIKTIFIQWFSVQRRTEGKVETDHLPPASPTRASTAAHEPALTHRHHPEPSALHRAHRMLYILWVWTNTGMYGALRYYTENLHGPKGPELHLFTSPPAPPSVICDLFTVSTVKWDISQKVM